MLLRKKIAAAVAITALWLHSAQNPMPNPDPGPGNMTVMVVAETADLSKLPVEQVNVLTASGIREYMAKHGTIRVVDPQTDLSLIEPVFGKFTKDNPPKSLPWAYIKKGLKKPYSGELPATEAAFQALLEKYGGK